MLIPNHPDDERLSALAEADPEAVGDEGLTSHIASCTRCAGLVDELGMLRASLAELPDLRPSRPLRLLPEVAEEPAVAGPADRLADFVRRLFGPALTAGAAIAMIGLVGTTVGPTMDQLFQNVGTTMSAVGERAGDAGGIESFESAAPAMGPGDGAAGQDFESDDGATTNGSEELAYREPPAERSPWPMVLFTGVAIVIGALMLRWILVPRAG